MKSNVRVNQFPEDLVKDLAWYTEDDLGTLDDGTPYRHFTVFIEGGYYHTNEYQGE